MSETTNVIDTTASTNGTVAPKTERQAALKRAATKVGAGKKTTPKAKATKKSQSPRSTTKTIHGVVCPTGKFWNEKRVEIVKALRKMGATTATTSRTAELVGKKANIEKHFVDRYCDENEPLVAGGIVKRVKLEDNRVLSYHLTALGNKCQLDY